MLAFLLHQVFSVSALLLDDALKPATPLISGVAGLSASSSSKEDTLNTWEEK